VTQTACRTSACQETPTDPRSAEITDSTNQARAVSLFPICLNGGIIIASFLGGQLANTRGTALAGMFPIFETFPYLLPMLLASLFPMISGFCALFFLKETLSTKIRKVDEEDVVEDEGVVRRKDVDGPTKASSSELVTKHIGLLIFTFAVQSFVGISMNALLPLFCFTPIESGGLGMDSESIGYVISQRSVTVLLLQVFGFPWLAKKLGLVRLHRWAMVLWVATFAIMPIINLAARSGPNWLVWSELYAFMVIGALAGVCSGECEVFWAQHAVSLSRPSHASSFPPLLRSTFPLLSPSCSLILLSPSSLPPLSSLLPPTPPCRVPSLLTDAPPQCATSS
jgi:Na+/melibiose symporter-like transporter